MSKMEDTRIPPFNKFTSITFEEKDSIKRKVQTVKDYLIDLENNEKEYYSTIHLTCIFSFEKDATIENWLLNSAESLVGSAITRPTALDWVQVAEINSMEVWPLFLSLSMDRIEKERLNIPVAAFQFWEQQDFKAMLTEIINKSAFLKKKKCKELRIC